MCPRSGAVERLGLKKKGWAVGPWMGPTRSAATVINVRAVGRGTLRERKSKKRKRNGPKEIDRETNQLRITAS